MPVRVSLVAALLAAVTAAMEASRLAPMPYVTYATDALRLTLFVSLGVIIVGTAAVIIVPAAGLIPPRAEGQTSGGGEEPLLTPSRTPECREPLPLLGIVGLEPEAGASTLAFNLAVLVAVDGVADVHRAAPRRPRPLCVLGDGALARRLGLSPERLRDHLERNTGRIGEDLVGLATRHVSGCELLCLPRGVMGRHQLRLLAMEVGRHYDLFVVDSFTGDPALRTGVEDIANVRIGVSVPTSTATTVDFLGESLTHKAWPTTALLMNKVCGDDRPFDTIWPGFENVTGLPWDSAVIKDDRLGMPWCLEPASPAAWMVRDLTARLLPHLIPSERHADRA